MKKKITRKKVKVKFWKYKKGEQFNFFLKENCVEHQDFIIDPGAANNMIKYGGTYAVSEKNFSGVIHNANKTQTSK